MGSALSLRATFSRHSVSVGYPNAFICVSTLDDPAFLYLTMKEQVIVPRFIVNHFLLFIVLNFMPFTWISFALCNGN